jgi:hypothetical protein
MLNAVYNLGLQIKQFEIRQTGIVLTQGDNQSIEFHIRILENEKDVNYTQATSRIVFLKADGNVVQGNMTSSPNGYIYQLGTNEIAVVGEVICSVLLYGANGERLSVSRFNFSVQEDALSPSAVESSTEMDALTKAIQLQKQLEDEVYTGTTVITLDNTASMIEITADTNGKPLDCQHVELIIKVPDNSIAKNGDQVYVMCQINNMSAAGDYCSLWGGATADWWMLGWFKNLGSAIHLDYDIAGGAVCVSGGVVAVGVSKTGTRDDVSSGTVYGYTTPINTFQTISKITLTAAYSQFPAGTVVVVRDIKK